MVDAKVLLERLRGVPTQSFAPGEFLLRAGARSGRLLVLREGRVEVSSEGVVLGEVDAPGAMMGEVAALLGGAHTADLRAQTRTVCHVIDAERVLREDPVVALQVAAVLAQRLDRLTRQVVELRHAARSGKSLDQPLDHLAKAVLLGGLP